MALRPLTPTRFHRAGVGSTPEALLDRAGALVGERQELRRRGASATALERNRVQIARTHWQLAHALLDRHHPRG